MSFDYTKADIVSALRTLGLSSGDSVFIHSNIGFFGRLEGASGQEDYYGMFKDSIFNVIGDAGTLVVPTFSYSFCKGEAFDSSATPTTCGFFSEMLRKDSQSLRSEDANFSVAAIGAKARLFTEDAPCFSFGEHSFWERFLIHKGKICNFNFDAGSTFVHYVERRLGVDYRFDKAFKGVSIRNGLERERVFHHWVYDKTKPEDTPDFTKFHRKAVAAGLAKTSNLGRGQMVLISAEDSFRLISDEIPRSPFFLRKGGG